MKITKSIEDYLEAIYVLSLKNKPVRIKDIATFLSVKLPSVTEAIDRLVKDGYAVHAPYEDVTLTKKGEYVGKNTWEKHQILFKFLKDILKVPQDKAFREACLVEHCISDETKDKLKKFMKSFQNNLGRIR